MSIEHLVTARDGGSLVRIEFAPLVLPHWNIDFTGCRGGVHNEAGRYYHFHNVHPGTYPEDALFNACYDLLGDRWVWAKMEWQGLVDWHGADGDDLALGATWQDCDCVESHQRWLAEMGLK